MVDTEIFAMETQPGGLQAVLSRLRHLPIVSVTFLPSASKLLHADVAILETELEVTSGALHVPGVISVEGSAEHVFYTTFRRDQFPPAKEATNRGLENISKRDLLSIIRPLPTGNIHSKMPLGAPGLFLGPSVGIERFKKDGSFQKILELIRAPQAWSYGRGQGQTIAIMDTGVDASRLAPWQIAGGFAPDGSDPFNDRIGHGSMVALTAAANGDAAGFNGVAPLAQVYSLKFKLRSNGSFATASILEALDHVIGVAWERKTRIVVNNSWGLFGCKNLALPCNILITRLLKAVDPLGSIITVWAAGNNRHLCPSDLPTAYCMGSSPWSVTVAAVDRSLLPHFYSAAGGQCYSLSPTLACPTFGVLPWGSGFLDFKEQGGGTSQAAPQVSGALALMLEQFPNAPNAVLRAALRAGARPVASDRKWTDYDWLTGSGLLQIDKSIAAIPTAQSHPSYAYEQNFPTSVTST